MLCFSFKTENSLLYSHEPSSYRTALPMHLCSQSRLVTQRCKKICKRDFLEDCIQGADLSERWAFSLPYFLPNCCLDFSCDGWNSCSCIGQSCNLGDGYHPSSGWPTSSFVSEGEKNKVYLAKVLVVLVFCNVNPNLILKILCV